MKQTAAIATAALVVALSAAGAQAGRVFRKGPYLQNVSKTSVTVMFEAARDGRAAIELLGTPRRRIEVEVRGVAEVVLDELRPGTRYRYAVTMGGQRSEGEFATAPEPESPFTFVVYGDSRSNAAPHQRVVERIRAEVPDFLIGTGDMVTDGSKERDWQQFFDIERELFRENPYFPAIGNHDRQGRGRTADAYRKYFALPENSPNPERYYAFTYGNSRFIVLDSNSYSFALSDQTAWLEQQLQAARLERDIRHIFVTMHHPPFSVSLHGGQKDLREAWTPLFETYRVDAVFSGHDHVYSRAQRAGVHYFVSGGSGAALYPRKRDSSPLDVEATRYFERVNHYLRVNVWEDLVEVTAVRADGSVIETLSWGHAPRVARDGAGEADPAAPAQGEPDETRRPGVGGPTAAPGARPSQLSSMRPRRLGWLGAVGVGMVFLAGVLLWLNLR